MSKLSRVHTVQKDHHQIVIQSPAGENPADFSVRLTNPIILDPNKHFVIGLHNAILTSSWNTAPLGVAYNVNGVDISIPKGHFSFESLKEYIKGNFIIETVPYLGKVKVIVPAGTTLVLQSIAPLLGFITGDTFTEGEYISANIADVSPVNFISVSSNIIDINSTRSNGNLRPLLRTALLPPCLEPYSYFDLCSNSDDYYVKCVRNEVMNIDIRVASDSGAVLDLNPSIPSFWTIIIKETELM